MNRRSLLARFGAALAALPFARQVAAQNVDDVAIPHSSDDPVVWNTDKGFAHAWAKYGRFDASKLSFEDVYFPAEPKYIAWDYAHATGPGDTIYASKETIAAWDRIMDEQRAVQPMPVIKISTDDTYSGRLIVRAPMSEVGAQEQG